MLQYLELEHVGPAPSMRLDFAPRLNLLTGDNGVGKTFALDIAWWGLTGTWSDSPAWPNRGRSMEPEIRCGVAGEPGKETESRIVYEAASQSWQVAGVGPRAPGLVVYAQVDGGFCVWDPARNYALHPSAKKVDGTNPPAAYRFSGEGLWNGVVDDGDVLCNGLIRDWCTWQDRHNEAFRALVEVMAGLSPDPQRPIRPGAPVRLSIADVRDIPTIELPYGTVPVTLASAGMRRILSLAYLMVWASSEHRTAAELSDRSAACRMVLLFDDVEAHLHPRWQRTLLPSVITVAKRLAESPEFEADVQVIATTHAPLVLASMETQFDEGRDRVLTFETHNGAVSVREVPWAKQGDAVGWLVSDVFGMRQARSREAEAAIEAAEALMRGDTDALPPDLRTREAIHQKLVEALPDHDPFWPRWIVEAEKANT